VACALIGSVTAGIAFAATSTTSNAPGVLISGTSVSVFVPNSTDNSLGSGASEVFIEPAAAPPKRFPTTGHTNACAASPQTGIVACSGLFGTSVLVRPNGSVGPFNTGVKKRIHFTGGDCANCGVVIDDAMGIAIISTSQGYLPVQLSPFHMNSIIPTNGEAISGNFGYDSNNHRILSPNYAILNLKHFMSGTPHFQIVDLASSKAFDLSDNDAFFNSTGTCQTRQGGTTQRDALPDSAAFDTTTNIAYVSFRSPSDCAGSNTVEDIGLFDMTQATFNPTNSTWSDSQKRIETLTEMSKLGNGITGIAIAPGTSLAIVSDRRETAFGTTGFGALQLPTTSGGGGFLGLQDWVQADMPNDPSGKGWQMSFMPNGLSAYISPNSSKAMGVIINQKRTFLAVIDIAGLLSATRQSGTAHTVSTSVDLVKQGIVRFVSIRK
jgi:hypothetical protein